MSYDITLSDNAARKIIELTTKEPQKGKKLRIAIEGGGCVGFKYQYSFIENHETDDHVITHNGAELIIDDMSAGLMAGSLIDYVESLGAASFEIKNPQSKSKCGCGRSFSP